VAKEAYPDPTATQGQGDWACVDLTPVKPLNKPVTLGTIKADKILKAAALVKHGRLSVMPLTREQFGRALELAETKTQDRLSPALRCDSFYL